MTDTVYIVGSGAQGRVIQELIESNNSSIVIKYIDDNESLWGNKINGCDVVGGIDYLGSINKPNVHVAIGQPHIKEKIVKKIELLNVNFVNVIHASAQISKRSIVGKGISIGANSVINTGVYIDDFCIINSAVVVEHDASIKAFANISPSVCVGGRAVIGENSFVGSGAIILARVNIGINSIIGMGSVVMKDVIKDALYYGVPAKMIRNIDSEYNWKSIL